MRRLLHKLKQPNTYLNMFIFLLILSFFVVVIFPFIAAFLGSFKTTKEMLISSHFFPENWQFSNYHEAWVKANFARYTFNSLWYTILSVVVVVITSSMNGYAFARGEFRGKKLIFGMFASLMFVTLGTSSLYPSLKIMNMFHLDKSLMGLVVRSALSLHVADMYIVRNFVESLPKELDEAATIDGCGFYGIFFKIVLPLIKPVLATVAILTFAGSWNSYLWPMIVTMGDPDSYPLSVGLRALQVSGNAAASWNVVLAGSMISAVPMMIFYIFFNKFFVKGLAAGAVKG